MLYDETPCFGAVKARTVAAGKVQFPIEVAIEGVPTELTLADAVKLRDGLAAAIRIVETAESAPVADNAHCFLIGSTKYARSEPPTKLRR